MGHQHCGCSRGLIKNSGIRIATETNHSAHTHTFGSARNHLRAMAEDLLQVAGMLASAIGDLAAAKSLVAFISVGLSWLQGLAMASYTPGALAIGIV